MDPVGVEVVKTGRSIVNIVKGRGRGRLSWVCWVIAHPAMPVRRIMAWDRGV